MGKVITLCGARAPERVKRSLKYCVRAKEFLKQNNIEFEDIDVSEDPAKAEEMVQKTGQMGVPVLDIDGEIIVGFDQAAISRSLGIG